MSERNATFALLNALKRDVGGFTILFYPDYETREWLISEVKSLLNESQAFRTDSVDEAAAAQNRLVFLVTDNEVQLIDDLDGSRERFLNHTKPIVVLLVRGGSGQKQLAQGFSIASWASGNRIDPDLLSQIDVSAEREAWSAATQQTPEEWLAEWRAGKLADTAENDALSYRALLLEQQ